VDDVDIRVACSGSEALDLLAEAVAPPLAAVVTDLEMPNSGGLELIERIRGNPLWVGVPVIVSSGSTDPDAPAKAKRAGADAYFTKPYSPGDLRRELERLLEERSDA
jgi:CheY-like chemotaxis protein